MARRVGTTRGSRGAHVSPRAVKMYLPYGGKECACQQAAWRQGEMGVRVRQSGVGHGECEIARGGEAEEVGAGAYTSAAMSR